MELARDLMKLQFICAKLLQRLWNWPSKYLTNISRRNFRRDSGLESNTALIAVSILSLFDERATNRLVGPYPCKKMAPASVSPRDCVGYGYHRGISGRMKWNLSKSYLNLVSRKLSVVAFKLFHSSFLQFDLIRLDLI